jgi:hypothetical protein
MRSAFSSSMAGGLLYGRPDGLAASEDICEPGAGQKLGQPREIVARLEATAQGLDIRYAVTSLHGKPQHLIRPYCGT